MIYEYCGCGDTDAFECERFGCQRTRQKAKHVVKPSALAREVRHHLEGCENGVAKVPREFLSRVLATIEGLS
jgi:hypothetical protein